jgi:pseudaminic acid biosynthesis-associated methylase
MGDSQSQPETKRLEALWSGQFGDEYVERNARAAEKRAGFWQMILADLQPRRALEVGCNLGANLRWIAEATGAENTYGIDVNQKALERVHATLPGVNAILSPARELPFRDRWFDLVFTMGVLIHQPESTLPLVMSEIVRCSRRYVLCGEYHAEETTEVAYRGQEGALFKRDYGRIYQELFPELKLHKQGFLGPEEGFDDVTYWVFQKS